MANELRRRLHLAVKRRLAGDTLGCWLSGGLDSSVLAALARPFVTHLHTFVAGVPGAPDVEAARAVAGYLKAEHHEVMVDLPGLLDVLPRVIYHLESFDALLVRSSLTNYLVAGEAARYVPAVLSGEASDELFAGYAYLAGLPSGRLAGELLELIAGLHNTALQRVDRCAAAHGLLAYVPFTDPAVVDYALCIPPELKRRDGVEKWILRHAFSGALPEAILWRKKAKFWEGAGVGKMMAEYAEERIGDAAFLGERRLPNGWLLRTKEELLYYRIFREHFGDLAELDWMGRTKET
jgi:asparagine synthase (glutamine-hydrolysing)